MVKEEISQPAREEQIEAQPQQQNSDIYVPQDVALKRMFIQAKKYSAINEKEKALYAFQSAMDYAQEVGDEQTCAMIHYEEGRLYDDFNQLSDALYNYNQAAEQSSNNNITYNSSIRISNIVSCIN